MCSFHKLLIHIENGNETVGTFLTLVRLSTIWCLPAPKNLLKTKEKGRNRNFALVYITRIHTLVSRAVLQASQIGGTEPRYRNKRMLS